MIGLGWIGGRYIALTICVCFTEPERLPETPQENILHLVFATPPNTTHVKPRVLNDRKTSLIFRVSPRSHLNLPKTRRVLGDC